MRSVQLAYFVPLCGRAFLSAEPEAAAARRCFVAEPTKTPDVIRYATLAQVGLEMVAPIGVGVLLDHQMNTLPWITVAGAVIGFAGGLYHLVAILNRKK